MREGTKGIAKGPWKTVYEGQDKTIYETRKSAKIKHRITFIF